MRLKRGRPATASAPHGLRQSVAAANAPGRVRPDAALCISDHADAPAPWETTASWAYVRGRGPGGRYVGHYPDAALSALARRLGYWARREMDVFCYFDNDVAAAAPQDALVLKRLVAAATAKC